MKRSFCLLCLATIVYGAVITDIEIRPKDSNTQLTFLSDAPLAPSIYTLKNPDRLVVEFTGVVWTLPGYTFPDINLGGINRISATTFTKRPDFLRVIVEMAGPYSYLTGIEGNNFVLTLLTGTTTPFEVWRASRAKTAPAVVEEAPPSPPVKRRVTPRRGLISLDLENADILTVLRALADYAGVNIVAGKDVKGNVTVRLHNVPWKKALEVILKATDLSYREDRDVIRVDYAKNLEKQDLDLPVASVVYRLQFADAKETEEQIRQILSSKGKVKTDVRSNSVVVTDVAPIQEKVKALIKKLDVEPQQVEIAVRVIDIDHSKTNELGIDWTLKGLETRILRGEITSNVAPSIVGFGRVNIGRVDALANLDANLRILESQGLTKTLANPRIVALNNREAKILGGKRFSVTVLDERGNPVTRFYEAGTKLEVTPTINSLEEITMHIKAEVSEVDEASVAAGKPIITTSEAETKVQVKNGGTVVLGGFISRKEEKTVKGIPILRSIPIIGALFRESVKTYKDRELLIFITPTIVKEVSG
ncbi:hypothetical protein DRP53_03335 [candidate division WOR-3 bacterium]|uniref:Secretin/TonB short N-terminal domain-containing protein n=1 Tax=candidate division WOR-3 bacterium TaxID=2052148 RepID=A0A660SLG1_UNCW3|nr:MAG: hypothetical protein DRP53_03335 [candidate division WOR-3 bacterium]